MTTWTALTTLPTEAAAQELGLALERMQPPPSGIGVFEIEDGSGLWEVGGYFESRPDPAGLMLLAAMHGAADFAVARVDDRDWVAQVRREMVPVEAGRFVVHGGHDAHRIGANRWGLLIEAAMAFGTGHHGTTRGCLLALDRLVRAGWRPRRVADIGCGTGVLAMAAARAWRVRCAASDIDDVAVATARANVAANGLGPWVQVGGGAGFAAPVLRGGAPYDLVLANILAGPLKRLAPGIARALAPGGVAILSGLLTPQAAGVEAVCRGHGLRRQTRITLAPWTTLVLRKD